MTSNDEKKSRGPKTTQIPWFLGCFVIQTNHHFGCHLCIIMAFIRTVGWDISNISPSPKKDLPRIWRFLHLEGRASWHFFSGGPLPRGWRAGGARLWLEACFSDENLGVIVRKAGAATWLTQCRCRRIQGGPARWDGGLFFGHKKGGRGGEIDTQLSSIVK